MRGLIKIDYLYQCRVCQDYYWFHFYEEEERVESSRKLTKDEAVILRLRIPMTKAGDCTCPRCWELALEKKRYEARYL
jgi:hypothetical protein